MTNQTNNYESPQVVEVEFELEGTILAYSAEDGDARPF